MNNNNQKSELDIKIEDAIKVATQYYTHTEDAEVMIATYGLINSADAITARQAELMYLEKVLSKFGVYLSPTRSLIWDLATAKKDDTSLINIVISYFIPDEDHLPVGEIAHLSFGDIQDAFHAACTRNNLNIAKYLAEVLGDNINRESLEFTIKYSKEKGNNEVVEWLRAKYCE